MSRMHHAVCMTRGPLVSWRLSSSEGRQRLNGGVNKTQAAMRARMRRGVAEHVTRGFDSGRAICLRRPCKPSPRAAFARFTRLWLLQEENQGAGIREDGQGHCFSVLLPVHESEEYRVPKGITAMALTGVQMKPDIGNSLPSPWAADCGSYKNPAFLHG